MKPLAFYIPENLRPRDVPRPMRLYACYFLNLIHWKSCCWQPDERGWVRLKVEYLVKVIPRDVWPELLELLWIKRGIIHHDETYSPGERSRGYRLAPAYRKVRRIECGNPDFIKKVRAAYDSESVPLLPVHQWLAAKLEDLSFDLSRAESIISGLMPDESSTDDVETYHHRLTGLAIRMANGDWSLSCCQYGRTHTEITRLHRDLRCCLSHAGEPLVNVDLANSQPLIAGIMADGFYRHRDAARRLVGRTYSLKAHPYRHRFPQPVRATRADLRAYLDVCEAGKLYESLMDKSDDRTAVKKMLLALMYDRNKKKRSALQRQFENKYPCVAEMLRILKSRDYRRASWLMQSSESAIMLGGAARRLMEAHPDIPVVTIHDSIMTTRKHVPIVRDVIVEVFEEIGISPTLKIEEQK